MALGSRFPSAGRALAMVGACGSRSGAPAYSRHRDPGFGGWTAMAGHVALVFQRSGGLGGSGRSSMRSHLDALQKYPVVPLAPFGTVGFSLRGFKSAGTLGCPFM